MKTTIEPFRTKAVEPIKFSTAGQRQELLQRAGYNLFQLKAEDVIIDLLTDSGTAAMSSEQWSAVMRADESYAGCQSFYRFSSTIEEIFGFKEILPVHQGRAAERILFSSLVKPGDIIPSNTHFDTTRANIEALGGTALDLPCAHAINSNSIHAFNGNIDIEAVSRLVRSHRELIPFAMITITNNACAGQPVALSNIRNYAALLREYDIPFYIDAARFAENAYLIKTREPGCQYKTIAAIVREIFALADGCLMSAKKDGLANIGAFIGLRDSNLAGRLKDDLIRTEGFPTYGGLSGRDLEAIAVGLKEAISEDYLKYRAASASYLARGLRKVGVPLVTPPALHAVYIDAAKFLPNIPPLKFPGQVVACELYLEAGIRTCEIGSVMFGSKNAETGEEIPARSELVRLALPRRVYSQSHYDYVIEAAANVIERRRDLNGMRMVFQPASLRHFTAKFEPLTKAPSRYSDVSSPRSLRSEDGAVQVGERQ
jgi:tryptophanase